VIDSAQHFSVAADTASLPGSVVFTGSQENIVFQGYTRYTAEKGAAIMAATSQLAGAHTKADSTRLRDKIKTLNTEIQNYREQLVAK
jgi:hypothetical protein